MPNRTTTLASTIFATVLAGTGLMSAVCAPARAADDCLRAPNQQTSAGGHWRYRVDRQHQRKCWYLADEAHTDQVSSAKAAPSAGKNSQRATEKMPQANADARAELPVLPALKYTEPLVYAEPFMDGPPRRAAENPVARSGNPLLNSAAAGGSEPAATSAVKDASTDAAPEALPAAAEHVPAAELAADEPAAAELAADEPAISTFRLTLSLLLMAMGIAAVVAGVVSKRSNPVRARRNDVAFHMRNTEAEEVFEEMTSEERTSLALAQDVPLFLVHGRPGRD
jgi:hypothetical protein